MSKQSTIIKPHINNQLSMNKSLVNHQLSITKPHINHQLSLNKLQINHQFSIIHYQLTIDFSLQCTSAAAEWLSCPQLLWPGSALPARRPLHRRARSGRPHGDRPSDRSAVRYAWGAGRLRGRLVVSWLMMVYNYSWLIVELVYNVGWGL